MGQLALHATISGSSQPLARSSAAVPPWLRKHLSQHFHTSSTLPQSGDSRTGGGGVCGGGGGEGDGGGGGGNMQMHGQDEEHEPVLLTPKT